MIQFGGLTAFIRGKRVVPHVPAAMAVHLGNHAEDEIASPRRDKSSGLGLFIEYRDASGAYSSRRIACRRFDRGEAALHAWCFERERPRRFKVDRIESAACTETGELFELATLVADLQLRGLPVQDVRLGKVLSALVFLMRCDEEAHPTEQAVLERAVTSFAMRFDGDDEIVNQGMRLAATLAPDAGDFMKALRWIEKRHDCAQLARFLLSSAAQVIEADGRIHEEEVRFGTELGDVLTRIAKG